MSVNYKSNELNEALEQAFKRVYPYNEGMPPITYHAFKHGFFAGTDWQSEAKKELIIDEDDDKLIANICLSYRHDFGLLSMVEQNKIKYNCRLWLRAIKNNVKEIK